VGRSFSGDATLFPLIQAGPEQGFALIDVHGAIALSFNDSKGSQFPSRTTPKLFSTGVHAISCRELER